MKTSGKISSNLLDLKKIVEGTSDFTGQPFFESLVKNLAEVLNAYGVWVTEYNKEKNRLKALAFWLNGSFVQEYEYDVKGTPCEPVVESNRLCHFSEKVIDLFPTDPDLVKFGAVSYMGLALKDAKGKVLGHLALLDNKPMEELPEVFAIFNIFASRAGAELRRLQSEKRLMENEAKLHRLFNGLNECIIETTEYLQITQANEVTFSTFKFNIDNIAHQSLKDFFDYPSKKIIQNEIQKLNKQKQHTDSTKASFKLTCLTATNESFPAEISISSYWSEGLLFFTFFIKNIKELEQTQEKIRILNAEASLLREKLNAEHFDNIIGNSPALMEAISLVHQVAPTDSTVLIHGETGTGEELFAQAIHSNSLRKNKSFVTLNCAALPSELIESELFGHLKGAYTGATASREGRFALADQGTIFLDEIGELPLSLQPKLLRVLQQGEFDPVGSSKTRKVNVRVIAATNRDLMQEVRKGNFREDLYYRLNVIPIYVPPLRARGKDIILLADAFIAKISRRLNIKPSPLDESNQQALLAYTWPGNVRELQNIIERGLITSKDGYINLVPLLTISSPVKPLIEVKATDLSQDRVLTDDEMKELEIKNIRLALEKSKWKISGENGAAKLLKIPHTTLSSRILKLKIKRP